MTQKYLNNRMQKKPNDMEKIWQPKEHNENPND